MSIQGSLDQLKKQGHRITGGRKKIVQILDRSPRPVTAAEILKKMDVNKTTVYRELEFLEQEGVAAQVDLGDGVRRYELTALEHHHHVVCDKCGKVEDMEAETLEKSLELLEQRLAKKMGFRVIKHNLEFFGICGNCQSQ